MSIPKKYKIGYRINDWEIIGTLTNQNCPYICKCKCGKIINKNTQSLEKTICCQKCSLTKYKRESTAKRSYNVGSVVGNFEVVEIKKLNSGLSYVCKCKCGTIVTKDAFQFKKYPLCKKCSNENRAKKHLGKKYGNFEVIGIVEAQSRHRLKAKCLTCSNIIIAEKSALKIKKWCSNCISGLYPGRIIDGMTLIKRMGKSYWQIKCECGKIFKSLLSKYKGRISSCGCRRKKEKLEKAKKKIGIKFKYLKIIRIAGHDGKHIIFELKCICGNRIKRPNGNEFKSWSCGCRWHENSPKGEKCHSSKLNSVEVLSLRELAETGCYNRKELAEMFQISTSTASSIILKKRWKHI